MNRKAMEAHEKTVLSTRKAYLAHVFPTTIQKIMMCYSLTLGLRHVYFFTKKDPTADFISPILPWLFVGQYESASNMNLLLKYQITHILNVTVDIDNMFSAHFVYMKVPIEDDDSVDIKKIFRPTCAFIERVEKVKGKVRYNWVSVLCLDEYTYI